MSYGLEIRDVNNQLILSSASDMCFACLGVFTLQAIDWYQDVTPAPWVLFNIADTAGFKRVIVADTSEAPWYGTIELSIVDSVLNLDPTNGIYLKAQYGILDISISNVISYPEIQAMLFSWGD